jgi:WXXGXW repeat (2 copies)
MPAPTPIVAACIAMYAACGIALAQSVDLWAPPRTIGACSLAPGGPASATAPRLPLPPVPANDQPHPFLEAARSAVERGQTGEAPEALERAETRLLDRAVGKNSEQQPDDRRAVLDSGVARRAPPLPTTLSPVADVTPPPSGSPAVTYALLPGHWQLQGARYVWVPPEIALRRVEPRPLVEGRYVWRDGEWHWVPAHFEGN